MNCVLSALALVDGSAVHSRAAAGEFPFSAPVKRAFARVAEFAECGAVPFAVFERRWHSSGLFAGVLFPAVAAASGVPDFVRRLVCPAAVDTFCRCWVARACRRILMRLNFGRVVVVVGTSIWWPICVYVCCMIGSFVGSAGFSGSYGAAVKISWP